MVGELYILIVDKFIINNTISKFNSYIHVKKTGYESSLFHQIQAY